MKITRKKRRLKIFVPIASMGDIAFLLIIFFMLTSNFIKEAHVKLKQAKSPDIDKMEESKISVSVDKDGVIWLQGKECDIGYLKTAIEKIVEKTKESVVMLKVDKDLKEEYYGPVFMELSKAGVKIGLVGLKSYGYQEMQ